MSNAVATPAMPSELHDIACELSTFNLVVAYRDAINVIIYRKGSYFSTAMTFADAAALRDRLTAALAAVAAREAT